MFSIFYRKELFEQHGLTFYYDQLFILRFLVITQKLFLFSKLTQICQINTQLSLRISKKNGDSGNKYTILEFESF